LASMRAWRSKNRDRFHAAMRLWELKRTFPGNPELVEMLMEVWRAKRWLRERLEAADGQG
jgi:hypothetical protein